MEHRRLGDSELEVSAIALGSWLTYSGGIAREQTEACTRAAFDAGITFFDTANVYGRGAAETRVGRDPERLPARLLHAGDQGLLPDVPSDRGLSRKQILKQIDASLKRLRVDYVDLYQCHRYDDRDAAGGDDAGARPRSSTAGKARYIGFSEWPASTDRARRWRCRAWRSSSPASRSTRCCGASPRRR